MAQEKEQDANAAEIEVILAEMDYPANKQDLMDAAEDANETVMVFFEMLPEREYINRDQVKEASMEKREETDK